MTDPTPKPLALELADMLEIPYGSPSAEQQMSVAAELRRQHQAIVELRAALQSLLPILLQWHEEFPEYVGDKEAPAIAAARALLTKHQET